jgi:hypothetical protein
MIAGISRMSHERIMFLVRPSASTKPSLQRSVMSANRIPNLIIGARANRFNIIPPSQTALLWRPSITGYLTTLRHNDF